MVQGIGVVPLHLHRLPHEHRCLLPFCPQQSGHTAALVVLDELTGKLLLEPLALFAAGQKQVALHLHQPRSHFNKSAGGFRVGVCLLHRAGILIDQLQNGDVVQVHLMFGHKRQQ